MEATKTVSLWEKTAAWTSSQLRQRSLLVRLLQTAAPCPRVETAELSFFFYFKYGIKNVFSLKSPFQFSSVLFSNLFCMSWKNFTPG